MRPTGLLQLEHSPQEYALTPQAVGTGERERASGYIVLHIMQSTTINLIYTHHPPSKRAKYPHYAALKLDPFPCSGPVQHMPEWSGACITYYARAPLVRYMELLSLSLTCHMIQCQAYHTTTSGLQSPAMF